ncbi:hypothetical protein ACEZDB_38490, partial [Streptacidiphilus sp. N1-3]
GHPPTTRRLHHHTAQRTARTCGPHRSNKTSARPWPGPTAHHRASRTNKAGTDTAGQLTLKAVGHSDPLVIVLNGINDAQRTMVFTDELPALVERHSQHRTASAVNGYRPPADGQLAHRGVRTLTEPTSIDHPALDRATLAPDSDFQPAAGQQERLDAARRAEHQRRASQQ